MSSDPAPRPGARLLDRADSPCVGALEPSPNHGERRDGCVPSCLLLHYTGMADGPSAIRWLCDPKSQVSCHYVVAEDGRILQLVDEGRRAWHAGRSSWHGETDINSVSVGIEIINAGHQGGLPPYPDIQIDAVIALCRDILARHGIVAERVLAHSDVSPGRKQDPGELFPWRRLAEAGVGLWVPPRSPDDRPGLAPGSEGPEVRGLQAALRIYGYGLEPTGAFDAATERTVRAFQLHFRPERVDGVADRGTLRTLDAVLATQAALVAARSLA